MNTQQDFEEFLRLLEKNKIRGKYGSIKVNFIGKNELIKNKNSTGTLKDQADIDELK